MPTTVVELETEAVRDRKALDKIVDDLVRDHRAGKVKGALVCYITADNEYAWSVSPSMTMSEYAYMVSIFTADLHNCIGRRTTP